MIVNYDQVSPQFDDWEGEIRFTSLTATTFACREAWTLRCETPAKNTKTQQLIVNREQTVDLGETACPNR